MISSRPIVQYVVRVIWQYFVLAVRTNLITIQKEAIMNRRFIIVWGEKHVQSEKKKILLWCFDYSEAVAIIPFHSCGNPDSSGTRVYTTLMLSTKDNTTFDNRTKTLELNSLKERKDWALFSFPWELLKSSCFLLSLLESLFSLLHSKLP